MLRKVTLTLVACLLLQLYLRPSCAAIVERDLREPGDQLLTLDTDSRLAWLQLEPTLNRSFFDVSGQFENGGDFEGFRYATVAEFETLMSNAGILSFELLPDYRSEIISLQNLVGISGISGTTTFSLGMFADPSTGSFSRRAGTLFTTDTVGRIIINNQPNGPAINLGSWLVKTVQVPEPQSFAMIIAWISLALCHRGHRSFAIMAVRRDAFMKR